MIINPIIIERIEHFPGHFFLEHGHTLVTPKASGSESRPPV